MARKPKKAKGPKGPKGSKVPTPQRNLDPSLPIYQLRISIDGVDPPIWRRIQVENYHLGALHKIIQELFDWGDGRSHTFYRPWLGRSRRHGEIWDREKKVRLSHIVAENYERFVYVYSGDTWYHTVEIEATLPIEQGARYPLCLGGEGAAPDESVGGPKQWQSLIKAAGDLEKSRDRPEQSAPGRINLGAFNQDEIARRLYRLRLWLAGEMPPSETAVFSVQDDVRVKPGVVHPEWPDFPLGGWTGTVITVGNLTPPMYQIEWTPETLSLAHPVYARRCDRDDLNHDTMWLEEDQLVADPGGPVTLDEPVDLQTRPLSTDNPEDRVRMIFGATTDDRVPAVNRDTLETYRRHLVQSLHFPLEAEMESDYIGEENYPVTVRSLCELSQNAAGLEVEVSGGNDFFVVGLDEVVCPNNVDPIARLIQDYRQWFRDFGASFDSGEDEDEEDEDEDDEDDEDRPREFGPFDRNVDEADEAEDEEYDRDEDQDEEAFSDMPDRPAPLVRDETPNRNEPCPCGSGKKYKQCCLKKGI